MQTSAARFVPFFALALLGLGCSDDCVSACEARQGCADATDVEKKMNCDQTCDHLDDVGDSSGCDERIDDYTSCEADLDDACRDDSKCDAKFQTAIACVLAYCEARPTDAKCKAVANDYGLEL